MNKDRQYNAVIASFTEEQLVGFYEGEVSDKAGAKMELRLAIRWQ